MAARQMMIGMATNVANGMTPEQRLQWSKEQVYIALGNALNGAYSLGLGACPMTAFQPPEYAEILGLPDNLVPTVLVVDRLRRRAGHAENTPFGRRDSHLAARKPPWTSSSRASTPAPAWEPGWPR